MHNEGDHADAAAKRIRDDPDHDEYLRRWSGIYERANYEAGLAAYFLRKSHEWSERAFNADVHFPKVLEVGAGTGVHLAFVRHTFEEYWMTDLNTPFLDRALAAEPPPRAGAGRNEKHRQHEPYDPTSARLGVWFAFEAERGEVFLEIWHW